MINALAAAVAERAALTPDDPAATALSYPEGRCVATTLTTAELHSAAGRLANEIRDRTETADRVAILCEHGLEYVVAFLACLYSARTAVPLFPITMRRNAERLHAILDDAAPRLSLVSPGAQILAPDRVPTQHDVLVVDRNGRADDIRLDPIGDHPAYLQYTSGSTTSPAGVQITHGNLTAALEQLRSALDVVNRRPMVNWLPYFHDMGLVFALCLPLFTGVPAIGLAPAEFAKRPIRWLRACSDYHAGATASPNFGLTLAVSGTGAAEREGLDLSSLEVLLNGAEPIRAAALAAFTRTFAPHGFRYRAHTPGYGLAEATLPVTISRPSAAPICIEFDRTALSAGRAVVATTPQAGTALIDCGFPAGQSLRIVDPVTRTVLGDDEVGEIWVQGPNIGAGYAGSPDRSATTFEAVAEGASGRWLRTGDLGFVHDGGLYIAGRLRDTIIVDGRNHFPADIEATVAAAAPELRAGHIAAFGVDDGAGEKLILVAELDHTEIATPDIGRRIRRAVVADHGIAPAEILMLPRGTIPKTSSGKIRRVACRDHYRAGLFTTGISSRTESPLIATE
ncbi:fatty acyl-AMP ligase [Nocardia veterana]|uniref:Fatty acyl-AMP ligase n=1 Tax=Nocardia veterana TaxID=132249 RepID=A0A7X6LWD3_9NOCA|nr:fatty acyl-AMP ligase [Nocardia veterana]NKY85830.1 fatty acyl-AMP ligase [Nocardia veterana]